jgi:NodT family efflux transporter outer membrane factor (OMF) lipoprotein
MTARRLCSMLLLVALGGCAVGPRFHAPAPPQASSFTPQAATGATGADIQQVSEGGQVPGRWWRLFGSPQIDALVAEALAHNPDVAAQEAALRQARELLYAQRAAYLPTVSLGVDASRQRASQTLAPPLSSNASIFSLYTAQLSVSYAPDLFGGVRRQVEAARARADLQRDEADAAYLALTANVVETALQEASLREQIAATQAVIATEDRLFQIMERQHELGQISGADLAGQETALAQAEQNLPPLRRQLAQERDLLAALCGRLPADGPSATIEISSLALPQHVLIGAPSELVGRRPDVRAAAANLHAASAQVGVATAARLPSLTLGASGGGTAERIADLASTPSLFWSLAGGLAQPVFDAGALRHQQRAAVAAYDQAREQYRSTVLKAFQNVADAVQALRIDQDALRVAVRAEAAADRSLAIARKQVELGQVSGASVLNAEQAYQQARVALVQARTGRFLDTVAVYAALGAGDW